KIQGWINRMITNKKSFASNNVLDIEIDNKISGGETTRLALSTKIYTLIKNNKQILILDEPEQGCDPSQAYEVIGSILKTFPKKTIIIISHLESIHEKYQWNKIIK